MTVSGEASRGATRESCMLECQADLLLQGTLKLVSFPMASSKFQPGDDVELAPSPKIDSRRLVPLERKCHVPTVYREFLESEIRR
jgi:hypothetical protein